MSWSLNLPQEDLQRAITNKIIPEFCHLNKEALFMRISITVRDKILLIVSSCAAHVWMTADVICHIYSILLEVGCREESKVSTFPSDVQLLLL